jgi:hypothetical protein
MAASSPFPTCPSLAPALRIELVQRSDHPPSHGSLRDSLPTTYLATTTFNPANVVIFGDGLCGSACATFTNYLVRYLNVQTVVVHPRPGEKTEFQQFVRRTQFVLTRIARFRADRGSCPFAQ